MTQEQTAQEELPVGWGVAARIWIAMAWRVLAGMLLVSALFSGISSLLPASIDAAELRNQAVALAMIPLGIWATRAVLNKDFRRFRVSLHPRAPKVKKAAVAAEEPSSPVE